MEEPTFVSRLHLRNFRGFRHLDSTTLYPLTFIVGPNSSGKSSLAAAMMFLAQSGYLDGDGDRPIWNGRLIDLGSFNDTVYRHERVRSIIVGATVSSLYHSSWYSQSRRTERLHDVHLEAQVRSSKEPAGRLWSLAYEYADTDLSATVKHKPGKRLAYEMRFLSRERQWDLESDDYRMRYGQLQELVHSTTRRSRAAKRRIKDFAAALRALDQFSDGTHRVPSGRLPPRRWYDRGAPGRDQGSGRGVVWDGVEPSHITRSEQHFRHEALGRGLKAIGICRDVRVEDVSAYHTAIQVVDFVTGVEANLIDVGFGISQVFPVIQSILGHGSGPLYLEQPEVHLHPRAQSELGEMISLMSESRQVIVETHSEHLINRARFLIASGRLAAKNVGVLYVDRNKNGSIVTPIALDEEGNFVGQWPDGFFDERYRATLQLSAVQQERRR